MPRLGITVYLPPELEAQVMRAAKSRNRSASGVITAAVKTLFTANPDGIPEGAARQLARVEARLNKVTRDAAILKEALLLFVRVWIEHNPPLDPDMEEASAESAMARFRLYLDHLRRGLDPRGSIAGDWEAELDAAHGEARR
jgi:hypothetical protein